MNMEKDAYYLRVGTFVAIALVSAILVLSYFADGKSRLFHITYAIYFDGGVDGLSLGSPVTLKGIQVGQVSDISFASYETDQVRVLVNIQDTAPVRTDTVATIQIQGITGTSLISLNNEIKAEDTAPIQYLVKQPGEEYLVIRSKPSSIEELFASVPDMIAGITKLTNRAELLLSEENVAHINQTLAGVETMFGPLNQQSLGQLLVELNQATIEGKIALREIKMLARTLREDPSIILRGTQHEGTRLE